MLSKSTPEITLKAAYIFCCCDTVTFTLLHACSTSVFVKPLASNANTTDSVNALYVFNVSNTLDG